MFLCVYFYFDSLIFVCFLVVCFLYIVWFLHVSYRPAFTISFTKKTGNAIRALGRMATLSAQSRRNSEAAAASANNTPRPSISGGCMNSSIIANHRMTSLNEEEADNYDETKTPTIVGHRSRTDIEVRTNNFSHNNNNNNNNINHYKSCSERSDSGFSETCSACTAPHRCVCHNNVAASDKSASSGKSFDEMVPVVEDTPVPVLNSNVLHRKLEEIALTQRCVEEEDTPQSTSGSVSPTFGDRRTGLSRSFSSCSSELKLQLEKETIMKSDFTNTITMRKQSLELHKQKEVHHRPTVTVRVPSLDASGKVSKLTEKFSHIEPKTESINGSTPSPKRKMLPIVSTVLANPNPRVNRPESQPSPRACKDFSSVRDRFNNMAAITASPASASFKCNSSQFNSNRNLTVNSKCDQPTIPVGAFNRSPLRLSGRIKEARDQLTRSTDSTPVSSAHQQGGGSKSSAVNAANGQMSRSLIAERNRLNFEKASSFWKS